MSQILPNLQQANDDLRAQLAALQAKLANKSRVSFKVTEKGGVSVYGLGRFPVTLYKSQWESLMAQVEPLTKFLAENNAKLAVKD